MSKNRGFVCFWCDEIGATIKKKVNGDIIYFHKDCHREFLNQSSTAESFKNNRQIEED